MNAEPKSAAYEYSLSGREPVLGLHLTDDHLSRLTWLGLDLDVSLTEVMRAVLHVVLEDKASFESDAHQDRLVGTLQRLRRADG